MSRGVSARGSLLLWCTCSALEELWTQSCSPPPEETDTGQQPEDSVDGREHFQYNNAKTDFRS